MELSHGMDLAAVDELGRVLQTRADQLRHVSAEIEGALGALHWGGPDGAVFRERWWPEHRGRLLAVADDLHGFGQSAVNNAMEQRQASGGTSPANAAVGLVGAAAALTTLPSGWASMSTSDRARQLMRLGWSDGDRLWRQLSRPDRDALVAHLRGEGELGILPPEARYAVNRARVYDEYMRLNALPSPSDRDRQQLDLYGQLLREDDRYRVLTFDPSGDGRLVVVQGDLATAPNVVVQVPGISNGLHNFGGLMADGARLYGAAGPGDTAVVTWLGYDTPDTDAGFGSIRSEVEITTTPMAEAGAHQLRSFVSEIAAGQPDARMSVVGHSYGSVVAGLAAEQGMDVDNLVLIGSPGAGVHSVDSFVHDGHRPTVYVGVVGADPVVWGADEAYGGLLDDESRFGTNPYREGFGADERRIFPHVDPRDAHSAYYEGGSEQLRWIAGIVSP